MAGPVMRRGGRVALRAASVVPPLYQGACDTLCGLYAILNALTLTLQPRSPLGSEDARSLFQTGLLLLDARGALSECLRDGVPILLWHAVAQALCAAASEITGVVLTLERPFADRLPSTARAFAEIERMVEQCRAPLISLEGVLSHYSVISGYTPVSFRLFDSNGLQRIVRAACGTGIDKHAKRHWLDLRAMLVINAV